MAKARFYIADKVQEVGYRTFVIERILDSDLEGTARNLPDGRVEVLLEGEKEHILQFIEDLKKERPELAENPTVGGIEFNDSLIVPQAMRSSQGLLCGQFSKAVKHMVGVEKGMEELRGEMRDGFDKLPKAIAKELKDLIT